MILEMYISYEAISLPLFIQFWIIFKIFIAHPVDEVSCRARLKHDGTCTETRFGLSAKRTSPFKLVGGSVQSTTGSRGVRVSGSNGSNAGYTMFRGRVQDYWLPIPLTCFPFTSPTVRHRVPSHFNWTIPYTTSCTHSFISVLCSCFLMFFRPLILASTGSLSIKHEFIN